MYNNGTVHADQYTFLITSHSFLLRVRNVSDKSCRENQNTRFVFSDFFPVNRSVYEIMWEQFVERGGPQTDNMARAHTCSILKATSHTQNV